MKFGRLRAERNLKTRRGALAEHEIIRRGLGVAGDTKIRPVTDDRLALGEDIATLPGGAVLAAAGAALRRSRRARGLGRPRARHRATQKTRTAWAGEAKGVGETKVAVSYGGRRTGQFHQRP